MHEWLARDASFRSRFRQEVEAVRRVGGTFTAPVVASDPEAVRPWLATAFVAGPSLAEAVERNGPMAEGDVLEAAGGIGRELRIGWYKASAPNERTQRIVELIQQSCGEAGFAVKDVGSSDFYSKGLTERKFDAAVIGWDGRPTPAAWSVLLHSPRDDILAFNYGGYHDAKVDAWLVELAKEIDPGRQLTLLKQIERQLSEDLPTVALYSVPGVVFLDKQVTNVVPNGTVQGLTWDADRWDLR